MASSRWKLARRGSKAPRSTHKKSRDLEDKPFVVTKSPEVFQKMFGTAEPPSIFKGDGVKISPKQVLRDPFEAIVAYTIMRHRQEFEDVRDQCPYNTDLDTQELVFKQQMTWFVYDRIRPDTGITVVEEFVRNNDLPEDLAEDLLQTTKIFSDHFQVIKHTSHDLVVYGMRTRRAYSVLSNNPSLYLVGRVIEGCMYPYGRGKFKFCGITTTRIP